MRREFDGIEPGFVQCAVLLVRACMLQQRAPAGSAHHDAVHFKRTRDCDPISASAHVLRGRPD